MRNPHDRRLGLVRLEDRHAPATFTVTTTVDNGNNTAPTAGSLRAAILQANAAAGTDTITFSISGGGVQTITPPVPLPNITDSVTLDGTTQPGYSGTPVIRLSGANAGGTANGLTLSGHAGSLVKAVTIGGFGGFGVAFVGGSGHRITGSLIGLTQNGTAADGNGVGVAVIGSANVGIGSSAQADRNVISGNKGDGVRITDGANNTEVVGNFVGTDLTGNATVANTGNGVHVFAGATNAIVGRTDAGAGNIISGNAGNGVRVADPTTANASVQGNRIGRDFGGQARPNGGDGVRVEAAAGSNPAAGFKPGTTVRSNTIRSNRGAGVGVRDTARQVRISDNVIVENDGPGIQVDPTAQDGLAPPTIDAVTPGTGGQRVTGTFSGRPDTKYTVAVFGNATADSSGFGEGERQLLTQDVTTNSAGAGAFDLTVPSTSFGGFRTVTVTAFDAGDTSGFSNAVATSKATLSPRLFAVGAGRGTPTVAIFDPDGTQTATVTAFDGKLTGGVRVAVADFNADGLPDVVAGSGPGSATRVQVIDATTNAVLADFAPFEAAFTGGVYVAVGDLNGDGTPDLVITPDEGGGPRVDVYSGKGFGKIASFFGIADTNFRGGARPAVGDINGDGRVDLVVAAGFGGGPRVATFDGNTVTSGTPARLFGDFFAFEQTLRNGVFVAAGDLSGDGKAELVAGGGPGGGPRVTAFDGANLLANTYVPAANFFAGSDANRGGVRLAVRDVTQDGVADVLTGDGPGPAARVRIYSGADLRAGSAASRADFGVFSGSTDGVFVG